MNDITSTLRFIADASQAIGTMRTLQGEAAALNRSLSQVQQGIVRQQLGPGVSSVQRLSAQNGAGTFALPATSTIDQFNKTVRTTYQVVTQAADGTELFRSTLSKATGDLRLITQATANLTRVQAEQKTIVKDSLAAIAQQRSALSSLTTPARQRVADIVQEKEALKGVLQAQQAYRNALPNPRATNFKSSGYDIYVQKERARAIIDAEKQIAETQAQIRSAAARQGVATRSLNNFLANDPAVQQAEARLRALQLALPGTRAAQQALIETARQGITRAANGPAPLPAALDIVRRESPNLFNRLANQGLGREAGADGKFGAFSTRQLYESGADNLTLTRDLERNVTTLRGAYRGLSGELINVNASYAEGGRVIGRYGGVLSGLQNFLRQTVNNFQKVIQWGLATTAVFAGIGLATSAIDTVKTLDSSLNQLAITAELSSTQVSAVFDDLADIAYNTSTPLAEVVKAADDIALATKRANQSTEEWQASIKSLATSVGILTNITGLDTVRATDLLTSTMKQLNLESTDLTGILNKVTAVAGGQANSITDIVAGLGAMAEASQTAGLTMDETIGTVQVLGQVTSKSASEIATSFKNLVGSVDSVGGKKALERFGIGTKDEVTGELRNILEIYEEIQDKIRSGVIPESEIKDLIRGIAGGPRRAPDASALLANVDAIREAQERAAGATNQALVANAKYLDTIESKITQIQVKFDTFIQKAFGPAIKQTITDIAQGLGSLLDILSKVNPEFISGAINIIAFIAAFKLLSIGIKALFGGIGSIIAGFKIMNTAALVGSQSFLATGSTAVRASAQTIGAIEAEITALNFLIAKHEQQIAVAKLAGDAEAQAAAKAALANAQAARGALGGAPVSATAGKYSRFAGPLAYAAGGAALSAVSGGSLGQIIGGGAQGLGLGLLTSPVPLPHAKLAGVALLGIGTALQFVTGESKNAEKQTKATSAEILASINAYSEAQKTIADLTTQQSILSKEYSKVGDNVSESSRIVKEYAANAKELETANLALADSLKELTSEDVTSKFGKQIALAQSGGLSASSLKELQEKLYKEIFSKTNPELFLRDGNNLVAPSIISNKVGEQGSSSAVIDVLGGGKLGKIKTGTTTLDLANLKEAVDVLKLFNAEGTKITGIFAPTVTNIDAITAALVELASEGNEVAKEALATFENSQATLSAIGQADIFGKQQNALLATKAILGQITAEQQSIGQKNIELYQTAIGATATLPNKGAGFSPSNPASSGGSLYSEDVQKRIQDIFITTNGLIQLGKVSIEDARYLLDLLGLSTTLTGEKKELTDQEVGLFADQLGWQVQLTAEQQKQKDISEEMLAIQEALKAQSISALDDLASKTGDIQRQFLSGDITKKQRDAMLEGAEATEVLQQQMISLFEMLAANDGVLIQFEDRLSTIPGLENLVGKEADEASAILGEFFSSMDLTQKGAQGLITRILQLITALNAIPKDVVSNVTIAVNTVTGLSANAAQVYSNFRAKETGGNTTADAARADINKQIQDLMKQINNISPSNGTSFLGTVGGVRSSGGGSRSAGAGLDVSQIDLPEELYGANQSALIKEAIKRARALQKTIPGASKEASNDVVSILKGTQNLLTVRGVKDDLLRRALEELADIEKKRLEFETKADTIRRIRVGGGDFSAIANVPVNSRTGVSLGNSQGPLNVTLNLNGTVLTPAQLAQFADLVAASLKRQIAG